MRFSRLPAPRQIAPVAEAFHPRHLFNPRDGWFRRTERSVNKFLSAHFFPRVPGLRLAYAAQLDRHLTVSEADIELAGFGGDRGLRVLVLSDIHAGPFLRARTLQRTIERLMTLEPDLILLPGDFATVRTCEVADVVPVLQLLEAPLGVFGVLGNHDYYTRDTRGVSRLLENAGVQLLRNRGVPIERDGARLFLAGVDDLLEGRVELDRAVGSADPNVPIVVLSHNPDVFPMAVARGISLMIAGHTHGGQVRIPGLPVLVRMSRYRFDEGRFRCGESELLVTRGLGVTGLPLRFACAPEALHLRLRSPVESVR